MNEKLYNKDIYIPFIEFEDREFTVTYYDHALERAFQREINLNNFKKINLSKGELIELQVINRIPTKVVMRYNYNHNYDICFVILLEKKIIKTIWLNHKKDQHKTLDHSKYNKKLLTSC